LSREVEEEQPPISGNHNRKRGLARYARIPGRTAPGNQQQD